MMPTTPTTIAVERDEHGCTRLFRAAARGCLNDVMLLIDSGEAIHTLECANHIGTTPLNIAAIHGRDTIVRLLLTIGANPNQADNDGRTPLHYAVLRRNQSLMRLLFEYGASVFLRDRWDRTPIEMVDNMRDVVRQCSTALGADLDELYVMAAILSGAIS
jgi:ankyrin repeat protein